MIDDARWERLRQREAELVRQLKAIQQEAMERSMPLAQELYDLREHRDPKTHVVNGVAYVYTGPRPPYLLPEEKDAGSK